MSKEKFYPTCYEEQETHIWLDHHMGQVIVDTNRKATYDKLVKKLGEPKDKQYIKNILAGARWEKDFEDKQMVRQILSKTNLIGQAKGRIKK